MEKVNNFTVYGLRKPIPNFSLENRPFGSFYRCHLWGNGYKEWYPITIDTPADGNCLFHAILNATSMSYRLGMIHNKEIPRSNIVEAARIDLSAKLNTKPEGSEKTYYERLYDGHIKEFANHVPEFALQAMQSMLKPGNAIGYGYLGYLSDVFDIDIYILDGSTNDIYISDELPFHCKGTRDSVVLRYINSHYELVGLLKEQEIVSYFSHDNLFLKFLYQKVYTLLYNQKKIVNRIVPAEYKLKVSKKEYEFLLTYRDILSSVLEVIETPDFDPSKWLYNRKSMMPFAPDHAMKELPILPKELPFLPKEDIPETKEDITETEKDDDTTIPEI